MRVIGSSGTTYTVSGYLGNTRSKGAVLRPQQITANVYAVGAVAFSVLLQVLALWFDPLARVLDVQPLTMSEALAVVVAGAVPAVIGQAVKLLTAKPTAAQTISL